MRVAVFDTHRFEKPFLEAAATEGAEIEPSFFEPRLSAETAGLAVGYPAVCVFTNDRLDARCLEKLRAGGTAFVALRCAGFNNVDLAAATRLGIRVARVPAYSPHAVAEHAVALILALNRKICRAAARVHELNFSLDGLVGFDLYGKKAGIIGTGRIGEVAARILRGFGCEVLLSDAHPREELAREIGARYVPLDVLLAQSDVVSLHVPLTPETRHLLDDRAFSLMKQGVMLINTGRGALIDTPALIRALKCGRVGAAGLDVYEEEESVFFQDLSDRVLQDDVLARLLTFPNVMITAHQAFLTQEALGNIARTTFENLRSYSRNESIPNEVRP